VTRFQYVDPFFFFPMESESREVWQPKLYWIHPGRRVFAAVPGIGAADDNLKIEKDTPGARSTARSSAAEPHATHDMSILTGRCTRKRGAPRP
jgi:hypothetical protein